MEYKLLNKRREGNGIISEVISMSEDRLIHFQIERRNGKTFMRMKSRSLLKSS